MSLFIINEVTDYFNSYFILNVIFIINCDEVPIYINLLTKAKNKVKNSKEKNKQITPSIYNSNLGKDK